MKLSMSLTDPTDVLDVLQNSSVGHLTLGMTALRYMVRNVVKCSFCSICLVCPFHLFCASLLTDPARPTEAKDSTCWYEE